MAQEIKKISSVVSEIGMPFRKIKKLLNKPMLKPDDFLTENDFSLLKRYKAMIQVKELTKAEKKKKIRQLEKAKDKSPRQENPYAPRGIAKSGKVDIISTPMGGKVR
jgi:DNA-binding transcriptional MerR regulator